MAFSSGTFSLVAGNPVVTNTTISSTVMNNTLSDIATGLSTAVLKDGTQTTTASVPFAEGLSSAKLVDISGAAAGQIKFPATQNASSNANTLDDYEEGTWTPTWASLTETPGGGTITHSGTYTKIGRVVYWTAKIVQTGGATVASTVGSTRITNLPFTVGINNCCTVSNSGASTTGPNGVNLVENGGTDAYVPGWTASTLDITISGWYSV